MQEQYEIRYNYQKDDGFWVISATEDIWVKVTNEKCNHEKAEKEFLKKTKKKNATVTCISYC